MHVKMSEYFQGRGAFGLLLPRLNRVELLEPGREYEVDDALAAYLIHNRKAVQVNTLPLPVHLNVEPQFEQAEEPPKPTTLRAARKRGKQ